MLNNLHAIMIISMNFAVSFYEKIEAGIVANLESCAGRVVKILRANLALIMVL